MTWKRGASLVAVALTVMVLLLVYARRSGPDFKVYVASGEAVLRGEDIYEAPLPARNTGPPFFSLFCVAPALLDRVSPTFARGVWTAVNVGALFLILGLAARLVYGRGLPVASPPLLLALFLTLPYLLYHFQYHQVNLIVFALTLAGMKLQEDRKEALGGLLVGLASALKVMPILFVPYLAYRRRWRAALSALAATAAFTVSPALVMGWDRFGSVFSTWRTMVPNNPCWGAGQRNQSLLAMWDRILGHGCIPLVSPGLNSLEMSGADSVRWAWLATGAVLGLLMLVAFRVPPRRGTVDAVAEWSAILAASAILGPVGWKHYFVVLLLPNLLLVRVWRSHAEGATRRIAGAALWGCFLLNLASSRNFSPGTWCLRLCMASIPVLAMLTLIGGLLWLRRRTAGNLGGWGAGAPGAEPAPEGSGVLSPVPPGVGP